MPSLDLYREPDPFRVPTLREFRDLIDVEEFLTMCTAGFPEPKTFSRRVSRILRERADEFDVAHDNQVLGSGMLDIEGYGLPLITTVHHPITFDRRIDLGPDPQPLPQADAAPLVRLPAHAGAGRPPGALDPDAVGDLQARHRRATSGSTPPACR